jgi:hypothetical protein
MIRARLDRLVSQPWNSRTLLAAMAVPLLTACVTPYQLPQGRDKAMLRLRSNTGDLTLFRVVDLSSCPAPPSTNNLAKTQRGENEVSKLSMHGTTTEPVDNVREREIAAGKRVVMIGTSWIIATQFTSGYSCISGAAFTPQPNRQYEVNYILDSGRCGVRVFQLTQNAAGQVERRLDPDSRPARITSNTDYCVYQ